MKFSSRLVLLASFSLALALAIWWALNWSEDKQRPHMQRADTIIRILLEIDALHNYSVAYQDYQDRLTIDQWLDKQRQIEPLLHSLNTVDNTQKTLVRSIRSMNHSAFLIFKRLIANDSNALEPANGHDSANSELFNRLNSALQAMTEDGFRLSHYSQTRTRELTNQSFLLVKLLLTALALTLTLSAIRLAMIFRQRIQQLNSGIEQVSNHDYDVELQESPDELGLLASHFNQMSAKLQAHVIKRDELEQEVARQTDTLEQQKENLKHQAEHDALTHLPNRVLFLESLQNAIERSKRTETRVAMLFIDLDDFKQINDTLGHQVGDWVLKEVTERFKSVMRSNDLIARLGGDEFTVIQEPLQDINDASILARKLLESLISPLNYEDHQFHLHASIGISLHPDNGGDAITLMRNADIAMYKAKDTGGGRFQFYSEAMTQEARQRLELESDIRRGLEHHEFKVYYQGQYTLHSNQLTGAEALVRWHHPHKGVLLPEAFIPLAEETGLIVQIGQQVLLQACQQAQLWRDQGLNLGTLAVNISGKQIYSESLVGSVDKAMAETGWPASKLELEVKESFIMGHSKQTLNVLKQLRALNLTLSIDDFGTGYSSLAYLKKLPINKLKIDQSFVHNIDHDLDDQAIIKAIIALGKSLGLTVIAEGVESPEQALFLKQQGCTEAQGFLYGRPMDTENFATQMISQLQTSQLKSL
ncbi:MAG: EAL domain-containing protein [Motiliproteus sp.]